MLSGKLWVMRFKTGRQRSRKPRQSTRGIDSQASNLVNKGGKTTQEDVDAIKAVVALVNAMTQIGSTLANILAR